MFTHSTSPNEKEFIQKFTKGVLPYFIDKSNNKRQNRMNILRKRSNTTNVNGLWTID